MSQPSNVLLIHEGRKSGNRYRTRIWFATIDGHVWLGSLDRNRSWVKNVRAKGGAKLDFGDGPIAVNCRYTEDADEIVRYERAIGRAHPIASRLVRLFVRGEPCAFETDLKGPPQGTR